MFYRAIVTLYPICDASTSGYRETRAHGWRPEVGPGLRETMWPRAARDTHPRLPGEDAGSAVRTGGRRLGASRRDPGGEATSRWANKPNERPGQAARDAPPVVVKARAAHAGRTASATMDPDKQGKTPSQVTCSSAVARAGMRLEWPDGALRC